MSLCPVTVKLPPVDPDRPGGLGLRCRSEFPVTVDDAER